MMDKKKILKEIQIISNNFQAKKYLETISKSKKLLRYLPNNEFLNNMVGLSFLNMGNIEDAKNLYSKITKSSPNIISYQNNYANVLKSQNEFIEAEKILERILERKPDYINALNNLANIKKTLQKYKAALKLFEQCLTLEPKNITILYNIALCHRSLRNFEQVKKYAIKIIDINPTFTLADKIISEVHNYKQDDINHYNLMKEKLNNKEIKNFEKSTLLFCLSKACEDRNDFEMSFKFLNEGNDIKKKEITFNLGKEIEEFKRIKELFKTEIPEIKIKDLKKKIIFICGMPRSGTTLVEQIISAHSKVRALGETEYLQKIINNVFENFNLTIDHILSKHKSELSFIYDNFLKYIDKIDDKSLIFTDKSLLNFKIIGFIKEFLPNSKIIVLKRDRNNNLLSIYKNDLQAKGLGWTYDINQILDYYKLFNSYMELWANSYEKSFLEVNYSDLINNPRQITKKIISYCDLDWDDNCLKYYKVNKSAIDTASANQANKPIYSSSLNKFEHYKKFFNLK